MERVDKTIRALPRIIGIAAVGIGLSTNDNIPVAEARATAGAPTTTTFDVDDFDNLCTPRIEHLAGKLALQSNLVQAPNGISTAQNIITGFLSEGGINRYRINGISSAFQNDSVGTYSSHATFQAIGLNGEPNTNFRARLLKINGGTKMDSVVFMCPGGEEITFPDLLATSQNSTPRGITL